MIYRILPVLWAFVTLVTFAPEPAVAQDSVSEGPVALTPHGDPDIQGIFTFRTLTPLNRPEALVGKEALSLEEAAAFEAVAPPIPIQFT